METTETYFDKKGSERARGIYCNKSYTYGSSLHGTKNLKRYMENCPKSVNTSAHQLMLDYENKLRTKRICQKTYGEKMVVGTIKHNYSFSIVEHFQ